MYTGTNFTVACTVTSHHCSETYIRSLHDDSNVIGWKLLHPPENFVNYICICLRLWDIKFINVTHSSNILIISLLCNKEN